MLVLTALLAAASLAFAQASDYRIGPTDVLKVTVWGHDDLSRAAVVSAEGRIAFPLVGDVPVAGLTPTQVETRLRELLEPGAILVEPRAQRLVHGREGEHHRVPLHLDPLRLRHDHPVEHLVLLANGGEQGGLRVHI